MPIPDFDSTGLLPAGIHDCTLQEMQLRFAWNTHRTGLYGKLQTFMTSELRQRFPDPVYCNGSFVTDKDLPEDTDIVLDLRLAPVARQLAGVLFMANEQPRLMAQYAVHFWIDLPGANCFSLYFQYTGIKTAQIKGLDPHHLKGILRLA